MEAFSVSQANVFPAGLLSLPPSRTAPTHSSHLPAFPQHDACPEKKLHPGEPWPWLCHPITLYLKDLKSSNVQDSQERGPLPVGLVQGFVHTAEDPAEKALVRGLGQSLDGKVGLWGERGDTVTPVGCVFTGTQQMAPIFILLLLLIGPQKTHTHKKETTPCLHPAESGREGERAQI